MPNGVQSDRASDGWGFPRLSVRESAVPKSRLDCRLFYPFTLARLLPPIPPRAPDRAKSDRSGDDRVAGVDVAGDPEEGADGGKNARV